jgi:uncharacterized protein (DUF952 family)
LQAELRWEAADQDIFPHLYGPLYQRIAVTEFPTRTAYSLNLTSFS